MPELKKIPPTLPNVLGHVTENKFFSVWPIRFLPMIKKISYTGRDLLTHSLLIILKHYYCGSFLLNLNKFTGVQNY